MKLNMGNHGSQGDPYVIKSGKKYYMYATHSNGVQLYDSENRKDWRFRGFCFTKLDEKEYWAPAVLEYENKFWLYYSTMPIGESDTHRERICVAVCDKPDGMFEYVGELTPPFSIDPHVVESGGELYMFYSVNDYEAERAGTLIVVDKMKSPTQMCNHPKVVVRATLDEEIFMRDRFRKGQHWHTLEGAFYFRVGDYHYVTYSGNCYENEHYYLGYAVAKGDTDDLTSLEFHKYPDEHTYLPLVCINDKEEGTGHNSILEENGNYYLFYHGRDRDMKRTGSDQRTARVCEIKASNGVLTVIDR
jgi:beta-xylosidase